MSYKRDPLSDPHSGQGANAAPGGRPNPGSQKAIDAGCICPVLDNHHGRGYYGDGEVFVFTDGCTVHTFPKTEGELSP